MITSGGVEQPIVKKGYTDDNGPYIKIKLDFLVQRQLRALLNAIDAAAIANLGSKSESSVWILFSL